MMLTTYPEKKESVSDPPETSPTERGVSLEQGHFHPDNESPPACPDIGPPPDGGVQAWLCILGAFLICFACFGFNTSVGQLQQYYLDHQLREYSRASVGWITSISAFIVFTFSTISGRYFDIYGAKILTIIGTCLSFAGLVGIAFSREYWQFFLAHFSTGVAGTLLWAPATAIAGHWFDKRRSTAVGIVVAGSGLGGIVYPILIKRCTDDLGFRNGMLVIAGLNGGLLVVSSLTMKARLPRRPPPPWKALFGPWRESRYTALLLGQAIAQLAWASPYYNAPAYASSNSASKIISDYAITFLQTGAFVGRLSAGFLGDALGTWRVFFIITCLSGIVLLAIWIPSGLPGGAVTFGLVAYGYTSGAWMALLAACCATTSPPREYGMRVGMLWSLAGPPTLVSPVITGALISADKGKFAYAALFCGILFLVGGVVSVGPAALARISSILHRNSTRTTCAS